MGQPGIENYGLIDDSFAGLSRPQRTIDMGRPDLAGERPGATLVEAVRKFERDGGFKALREERDVARHRGQEPDAPTRRDAPIDVSIPTIATEGPALDRSED